MRKVSCLESCRPGGFSIALLRTSLSLNYLSPQPLHHIMNSINNHRENTPYTICNQSLEVPDRLLLAHLQMESLSDLEHGFIRLEFDIRDVGINH